MEREGAQYIFDETEGRFPCLRTVLVDQGYKGWLVNFAKRWFERVIGNQMLPFAQTSASSGGTVIIATNDGSRQCARNYLP